jgi:hypothetical protein
VLAALQGELLLGLAGSALETEDDLLGGLGLLVEDGLGLTTVTALLPVVTALTLGVQGGLCSKIRTLAFLFFLCGSGDSAVVWSGASRGEREGSFSHLASLVLGDLVLGVLVALPALAVGPAGFGNVDLFARYS